MKRHIFRLMMTIAILMLLSLDAIANNRNLNGSWHLDEGTGQIAYDSSAFGNNGQLGSTPDQDDNDPSWTDGYSGGALEFDGYNDYVDFGNIDEANFGFGPFTVAFWMYRNSYNLYAQSVSKARYNSGGWTFHDAPSRILLYVDETPISSHEDSIQNGIWYHVAATRDENHVVRLYLDGIEVALKVINKDSDSSFHLLLGKRSGVAFIDYFDGKIDELKIYSHALTDVEIMELAGFSTATPTSIPTCTPSQTPTSTSTPTFTPTQTPTQTATLSPTNTLSPTYSPTNSPTVTLSPTCSPTLSPTVTLSPTLTPTLTPTQTPTQTATLSPTNTLSPTYSPTNSSTVTLSPTCSPTLSPMLTPMLTSTYSPTSSPSATSSPTFTLTLTPTNSFTPSLTPTDTPVISPTPTSIPSPYVIPVIDATGILVLLGLATFVLTKLRNPRMKS